MQIHHRTLCINKYNIYVMKVSYIKIIFPILVFLSSLVFSISTKAQTTIIGTSSIWKYLDSGSNQGTNWRTPSFNDLTWASGASELGFGDLPVTTLAKFKIGYYFRKAVNISSPAQFANFTMKIRRDDGIVVYVNNVEVYRNNMPSGTINYNTPAASGCTDDGNTVFTSTLSNLLFVPGNNIIAVEVHNISTSSSDITFELQLIANPVPAIACAMPNVNLFGTRNLTSSTAEVFWTPIPGVQSYNVRYRIRNSGSLYSVAVNTTSALQVLTNLLPLTNYEWIIQSVCSGNALSAFTSSGWFTTLAASATTTLLRGPYLPIATSNSITIQWRTNNATNSEVKYGTIQTQLNNTTSDLNVNTEHAITLNNLQPNTKYYYSIGSANLVLQGDLNNYFYTSAAYGSTQPVKFWVTGDFGIGSSAQASVRNSFTNYTYGQIVNGWLWLGDNAYNSGTDQEYQNNVFDVYKSLFKNIPVFPTPGNHDYAQSGYQSPASLGVNFPYFNIFNLPAASGTEKYYSTNYSNIHFISLDSYGSYNNISSAMYNWLNTDLANNTQLWTIVYFHHPPFSMGSHNSDSEVELINMRNNIIPLLESYGVDLVLSGHSHSYERSYFIKNHTGPEITFNSSIYPAGNIIQAGDGPYTKTTRTGNGTVYVVCGVSGQSSSTTAPGYPHNAMFKSIINSYGSLILDVDGGNLTCKFLTSTDSINDQFTILKTISASAIGPGQFGKIDKSEIVSMIFPNPSSGNINIKLDNQEEILITVSIYNAVGNLLYKKDYTKIKDEIIQISRTETNLNSGIYIVKVDGETINTNNKLVIN